MSRRKTVSATLAVAVLAAVYFGWERNAPAAAPPKQPAPAGKPVKEKSVGNPIVVMETSEGAIKIELWAEMAPKTVENFLRYADEKFYDGTIFHRVIANFMIQGGGFTPDMKQKKTHAPIENEARGDLKNERGTLAMARTSDIHSATAQFFINVKDNPFLNRKGNTARTYGYAVFGKVIEGMDVVDKIKSAPTKTVGPFRDVPATPIVIQSVRRAEPAK